MSLLRYARNEFSQNGEDGVIAEIFEKIGSTTRWCCEFGAWDGIHFSNTRALIVTEWNPWSAVLIEPDPERFAELERNYVGYPNVWCVNAKVSPPEPLGEILADTPRLDLLVIDVDGLDYDILASLDIEPPRVVAVEVNAGHDPEAHGLVPRELAMNDVGQPFAEFVDLAADLGYRLVGYTGNAFFVHSDAGTQRTLPTIAALDAYRNSLRRLGPYDRDRLYLYNRGMVPPHHQFHNRHLSARKLGLSPLRALRVRRNASRY